MFSELALMMVMMWPAIPLFLIELHLAIGFWRRLGTWTYFVVVLEWLPIAAIVYLLQNAILFFEIALGLPFLIVGVLLIAGGVTLHTWTAKLIGLKATVGLSELKPEVQSEKQALITSGPFSVVRHPSYWAHTAIIIGVFLITGILAVGLIAVIDFAITYFVTTALEDKELIDRFGNQYREYQKRVPKLFPRVLKK